MTLKSKRWISSANTIVCKSLLGAPASFASTSSPQARCDVTNGRTSLCFPESESQRHAGLQQSACDPVSTECQQANDWLHNTSYDHGWNEHTRSSYEFARDTRMTVRDNNNNNNEYMSGRWVPNMSNSMSSLLLFLSRFLSSIAPRHSTKGS